MSIIEAIAFIHKIYHTLKFFFKLGRYVGS